MSAQRARAGTDEGARSAGGVHNHPMRKQVSQSWHRLATAYRLHCAREDAKLRNLVTPIGVWVCQHCPHVSLSTDGYLDHLAAAHA